MINNDVLRSLRYALGLGEPAMAAIFGLAGPEVGREEVARWLKKEDEEGYAECGDAEMMQFLDGLVIQRRGPSEHAPAPETATRLTNNLILKKLRVAFELKDADMHAILAQAEFPVSKPELSALFRKPGHKNYRACGDQLLRNFLKGLSLRLRG